MTEAININIPNQDCKINNLDAFFTKSREDSPPRNSPAIPLDYNQIITLYENNPEYQFIMEQSKILQKPEHIEIFKIIDANGDDYTCNENGVFVALNKLKPETLTEITKFIQFCLINKSQLIQDLNKRDAIREIMNCQNDDIKGFNKIFLLNDKN